VITRNVIHYIQERKFHSKHSTVSLFYLWTETLPSYRGITHTNRYVFE